MRATTGVHVSSVVTAIVFLGVLTISSTAVSHAQAPAESCRLMELGSDGLKSEECRTCHNWAGCHPSEVVYADAVERQIARNATFLRTEHEALSRGAFLPEGRVRCVTCHNRHSTEDAHLAIPLSTGRRAGTQALGTRADHSEKLLCLVCHPRD